ncbi:hypothetical protein LAV84_18345 [Rhizobium sp. VS19-DR104.2]|uniref:hypothetical protein n=1 Tax=unclassified Rhizobium TaxID=2613769 RepID=UPI001CC59819|nr:MULTISPECIES: hypothetical protein [unclassified Rhizobium]MBZ5775031.1 hypothetical protein [Rhizobium sp. VS19-DRK62.2]MBZ5803430.1 hypothetical protein [Rhizobium sp. VS19-DR181]MBZ5831683.1 hypothetical protein [Rhizobium sp. VS19-DR104.2]MBZ5843080.1 hypothetical protein [Rhizobium sp. VS19-DR104.1]
MSKFYSDHPRLAGIIAGALLGALIGLLLIPNFGVASGGRGHGVIGWIVGAIIGAYVGFRVVEWRQRKQIIAP